MSVPPLPPRRLILHVGTHKTGTTALQWFLAANRLPLAEAGIHYPLAGRHLRDGSGIASGHHQLAFDFAGAEGRASLSLLVDEIRVMQAATVVLSSEEFLPLAAKRGCLETIVATGRELGYEPIAVVVLRAQADYLESIFSEIAKTGSVSSIGDLIDQAAADGGFAPLNYPRAFELTYTGIIARLEAIFGSGNVVARAYRPDRGLEFGRTDFLGVIAQLRGGLRLRNVGNPGSSANERVTLLELLSNVARAKGGNTDVERLVRERFPGYDRANLGRPFTLITRADRLRLLSSFAADNATLNSRFGIEIPFVSESDISMSEDDDNRALAQRLLLAAVLEGTEAASGSRRRLTTVRDEFPEQGAGVGKTGKNVTAPRQRTGD